MMCQFPGLHASLLVNIECPAATLPAVFSITVVRDA
jgi:hypothetical protein